MKNKKLFLVSLLFIFGFFFFNTSNASADTLYFNGAVNSDWNTLGNWWIDSGFTSQALALPTTTDDVIISLTVGSNTGAAASVNTITVNGSAQIQIPITVSNGAVFNDSSKNSNEFNSLNQTGRQWMAITVAPNGNVYATTDGGDIYMQTGGVGSFTPLGQTGRYWYGIAAAPNGDVYASVSNGTIYKQTSGAGNFVSMGETIRNWYGMAAAPNGDVYAVVYGGDIYKQTGGVGSFVAVGAGNRNWFSISVGPDGDVFASVYGGDIYKQTGGVGSFVAVGAGNRNWWGVVVAPNNDVYASVIQGDIYKQTGGTGNFIALGLSSNFWYGLATSAGGEIYVVVRGGNIYKQSNGYITGNAVFNGNLTENTGTVTGVKTRKYTSDIVISRNFVSTGPWTVVTDGAVVNIYNATYDGTTTFQTLNGGSFDSDQPAGRTLYYNAVYPDSNWNSLSRWWNDSSYTSQATALPTSVDNVIINSYVESNTGPQPTVSTLTVNNGYLSGVNITVLSGATFTGPYAGYFNGTLTGVATFNTGAANYGTITGKAIFLEAHGGVLDQHGGRWGYGTSASNVGDDDVPISSWHFHGNGYNYGTLPSATFYDTFYNIGTITGTATYDYAHGGVITIADGGIWGSGTAGSNVGDDAVPITSWVFNGSSGTLYNAMISGDAVFNDTSYNYHGTVTGNAIFNGSSVNSKYGQNGTIQGNASFFDSSSNIGVVNGDACFAPSATNGGTVGGTITVCNVSAPTVTTLPVTFAYGNIPILKGQINTTGGDTPSEVGIEYGLDTNYGHTYSETGEFVAGDTFVTSDSTLECNIPYHFRVSATNSVDAAYSPDDTFTITECTSTASSFLYGVDGSGGNPDAPNLFLLDPDTGSKVSTIGPTGHNLTGIAFHPETGILYGSSGGNDIGGHTKSLFTINIDSGAATWQGAFKDNTNQTIIFPDIDFRPDGRLYGFSNSWGGDPSTADLYTIDITSCNGTSDTNCLVTKVGDSGLDPYANGLAFDSDDNLYFFGDGEGGYWKLDPDTGIPIGSEIDFANPSSVGASINAATFDADNVLYLARLDFGSPDANLATLNLDTNTFSSSGTNADMTFMDAIAFHNIDTAPSLEEITPVGTTTSDITPDYSFITDEAGTISYGGSCSSSSTEAEEGINTITLNELAEGTYSNCTITVTDSNNNESDPLIITTFTIDIPEPPTEEPQRRNRGGSSIPRDSFPPPPVINPSSQTSTPAESTEDITTLQNRINELLAQIKALTEGKTSFTSFVYTRDLTLGSMGEDVRALQQYLNTQGFIVAISGNGSIGNESTYFGVLTRDALAKFQKANNIVPSFGYFGSITRGFINK